MIITIIGSYKDKAKMLECKTFFERFGHTVNCPCSQERLEQPLITKHIEWLKNIEKSDLIVVISKNVTLVKGGSKYILEFGECTSYEMAFALKCDKQVVFW